MIGVVHLHASEHMTAVFFARAQTPPPEEELREMLEHRRLVTEQARHLSIVVYQLPSQHREMHNSLPWIRCRLSSLFLSPRPPTHLFLFSYSLLLSAF